MVEKVGEEKIFELVSDARQLAPFRSNLRTQLFKSGFSEKPIAEIVLAVDEVVVNIIRHSYAGKEGKIIIHYRDFSNRIEIAIRDHGKKFDPMKLPPPELPPKKPGGLGIYFVKTLMDKVEYDPSLPDGNQLTLTKFKPPAVS